MLRIICFTSLTLFFIFVFTPLKLTAQYIVEPEEYCIYSTIIDELYNGSNVELVIIRDCTGLDTSLDSLEDDLTYLHESIMRLHHDTTSDFKAKNIHSYTLSNFFNQRLDNKLISEDELSEIFDNGGWKDYYSKYPRSNGILTLSRVGFNSDKTQCLVYVGNQESKDLAEGFYFFMNKQAHGVWVVQDKKRIWGSWHIEDR